MAGHGKASPDFLFLCRCKTANLIDNEIHVTTETNKSKNTCAVFSSARKD